ncbi:MAG: hypothetical protein RIT45_1320 [Pseudomonadota bacterium]
MSTPAVTLTQLAVGSRASVSAIHGEDGLAARLLDLGLTPGAPVRLMRRAPLGGVLLVRVRDYLLALRPDEAARVSVAEAVG